MPVCTEVVPPEVRFSDGVRVACHLYPPGGDALAVAPGITVPATTSTTTSTTTTTAPAGTVDA
jgi:hypothetical protein